MTPYYTDTSALTKKYVEEAGTERMHRYLAEADGLFTSGLTELELLATLERLKRTHRLDSPAYRKVIAELTRDLRSGSIVLLEISREVLQTAKRILRQRHLRAPDAIQLATAMACHRASQGATQFLCADRPLLEAARLEGLRCCDVSG